jgi:hypothetical protein
MKEMEAVPRQREQVREEVEAKHRAARAAMKRSQDAQRAATEAMQRVANGLAQLEEIRRRRRTRPSDHSSLVG